MDEKYLCPHCHSDDVRRIEMVWKEQTGDINLDSVGATYGTGGVNVGYFKSKGQQFSKLAREAAPPETEKYANGFTGRSVPGLLSGSDFWRRGSFHWP